MKVQKTDPINLLADALQRLEIYCNASHRRAFRVYLDMIKKWSRAYNLTSIKDDREIIVKHFIDSISYIKAIPDNARTLLDVGSGAGFPGVPLKIIRPGLAVYLLEPSRKKSSFLKNLIKELGLSGIHVVGCRIEDYSPEDKGFPAKFDIIATRALFKTDQFIEKALPFCSERGLLIISKGPSYKEEVQDIKRVQCEVIDAGLAVYGLQRFLLLIKPHR